MKKGGGVTTPAAAHEGRFPGLGVSPYSLASARIGRRSAALVFIVALIVRALYLLDSADDPAFAVPIIDARVYDRAARAWLAGGGLSPDFFWQPSFYPFVLGILYALNGGSVVGVKVVQTFLGAATCALTAVLGGRLLGRTAGLVVGLITALYGPLIFYDAELLNHGWATFWAVLLLVLLLAAGEHGPAAGRGVILGLAGGLAVLTRAEFLPFLLTSAAWLGWRWLRAAAPRSRRVAALIGVVVGFAVPTLPAALANRRVTGHFGFLPAAGGINLYVGNHPDPEFVATAVGFNWNALGRQAVAAGATRPYDESRYFYRQTWAVVKADPWAALRRLGHKGLQLITSREIPRSRNVYDVRPWSRLQTVLTWKAGPFGFPFGVLLPLAVVGLVRERRRLPIPVWLFLASFSGAIVAVFVSGPYRLPLIPILAVLAAGGGLALAEVVRQRRWRVGVVMSVGLAAIAGVASVPGPFPLEDRDFEAGLWVGLGHALAEDGDTAAAVRCYQRELERHPLSIPAHTQLGLLLFEAGRAAEALTHFEHAVRTQPHAAETQGNYGLALSQVGRSDEAERALRTAVALEPRWAKPHSDLADLLRAHGRFAEAVDVYQAALALAPGNYKDHFNLGIALAELRRYEEAAEAFDAAVRLRPDVAQARFLLAVALEHAGRPAEACAAYQAALRLDPVHGPARERLERLLHPPAPASQRSP